MAAKNVPQFSLSIYANPRDLARVDKRLSKWQGAPLAKRLEKATSGAMSMVVPALRSAAPVSAAGHSGKYPHPPGNLQRRIRARPLRKRKGEVAAAYAGTTNYYGLWVQQGKGPGRRQPNEFVERVQRQLEPQINAFIDHQVRKLA